MRKGAGQIPEADQMRIKLAARGYAGRFTEGQITYRLEGYLKGASDEHRHLSPSIDRYPKWLSVDEAMPEAQQEVLAFEPIMGYIVQKSWWYHSDQDDKWFKRTYTHWMPLPEQPSESPAITDK